MDDGVTVLIIHNKQSNSNYLAHYDIRSTILYKENIYIYMCPVDVTSCLYMYLLITIVLRVIKFDTFIVLFFYRFWRRRDKDPIHVTLQTKSFNTSLSLTTLKRYVLNNLNYQKLRNHYIEITLLLFELKLLNF